MNQSTNQPFDIFFQLHKHKVTSGAYSEQDMQGPRALTAALRKKQYIKCNRNTMSKLTNKVSQKFFDYNCKSVDKFPLNSAHGTSDECLTMWHKNIQFTSCMYAHYLVKSWQSKL